MENNRNREGPSSPSSSPNNDPLHPPPPPPPPPESSTVTGNQSRTSPQNPPPPPRPSPRPRDIQGGAATIATTTAAPPTNNISQNQRPFTSPNTIDEAYSNSRDDTATNPSPYESLPIISVRVLAPKRYTLSPPKKRIRNQLTLSTIRHRQSQEEEEHEKKLGDIVRILLTPNLTESQLEACILQAAGVAAVEQVNEDNNECYETALQTKSRRKRPSSSSSNVTSFPTPTTQKLAGMFREADNVFIPLSYILSSPQLFQGQIFCLTRQPIMRQPPPTDALPSTNNHRIQRKTAMVTFSVMTALVSIVSAILFQFLLTNEENMSIQSMLATIHHSLETFDVQHALFLVRNTFDGFVSSLISLVVKIVEVIVEMPLRELYRHGPAVVGWEGASLPQICARITYHGDEDFWSKNWEECEKIYRLKEDAALRIRKPILYAILSYCLFLIIRSLVRIWLLRRRPERNMAETYAAFNMLVRQLKRAYNDC